MCSVFLLFISMAIAELGSSMPTSGGLYYWTHKYAPSGLKNILAWVCACMLTPNLLALGHDADIGGRSQMRTPSEALPVLPPLTGDVPYS